ncbi:unnamed protein product [Phytophthora fragariaefolia]|uniref:Unnamed protein product n=1 Tax=Phytophthora fragariaefolia TaxID=1490495 RepID=A0A9W7D9A3_9STRA|nr:unnamed protein product [Phytophthora fragariaefolia]
MGLLQVLLTVAITLFVISDGNASAANEVTGTESHALQNKRPTSADIPLTRGLADGDSEERKAGGGRGGRGGGRRGVRTTAYLYPSEVVRKGYSKFIGWLRRVFNVKTE